MDSDSGGVAVAGAGPLPGVHRFSHEAMATRFEVHAEHPDAGYAAQAAHAAFELADRLERQLSRFLPNSDIARVSDLAAGGSALVSPSAMECLVIARHVFDLTDGAFDVSIGTGLPSLDLDPDRCRVRATRPGVRIDLGGIGKGYAVDLMADLLEEWGIERALVHGGFSSVLAMEAPAGLDGWPLTLSDPGDSSHVFARLSPRQTALGASGLRKGDHIVDPRTGEPVRGRRGAWAAVARPHAPGAAPGAASSAAPGVEAPARAAAIGDALATAFMLMSIEEIDALCERSPGLEAWILAEPDRDRPGQPALLHRGDSGTGYTSASS